MAAQEIQRLHFGSARLWGQVNAGAALAYTQLQDVSIDFKTEIKTAFGEGNYAFAAADGHRTIDISAKHFVIDLPTLAVELGGSTPAAQTTAYAIDEAGAVGLTPFHYTLVNSALSPSQPVSIIVGVPTAGIVTPVPYTVVTAGLEVAGVSCSFTAGVLTFAAGDSGYAVKVTYKYVLGSSSGTSTLVTTNFQNSAPTFTLTAVRRDRSRVDSSTGLFIYEFNCVRSAGIKADYKEGDYTVYERSFQAFADPMGNVLTVRALNV